MKNRWRVLAAIIIFSNLFFGAWMVINGDIHFKSDVARDLLLFQEISDKKIMLLGPRASGIMGVYHGPLWLYTTYPAYILGSGNPVFLGWYWVGLVVVGLCILFVVARKLFTEKAAWIFLILASGYFIGDLKGLINPHGAFFVVPLMYFFLVRYFETRKAWYLVFTILMAGILIQYQMSIGIPFTLLTATLVSIVILKRRAYKHFLLFPIILLPLASFVIFEVRHDFAQLQAVLNLPGNTPRSLSDFIVSLEHRTKLAFLTSLQIFRFQFEKLAIIPTAIFACFFAFKLKNLSKLTKNRYFLFIYLFFGTWLLTLLIPGQILPHQWFPLTALVYLIFASLEKYVDQRIMFFLLTLIVLQNMVFWYQETLTVTQDTGIKTDSWKFHQQLSAWIIQDGEAEFGYFTFTPDLYAYAPKYTMRYLMRQHPEKTIAPFEKKSVTYVLSEPVPEDRRDISPLEWRKSKFGITADPTKKIVFPNGYMIERFDLSPEETQVPIDRDLDTGVFYR